MGSTEFECLHGSIAKMIINPKQPSWDKQIAVAIVPCEQRFIRVFPKCFTEFAEFSD